MLQVSGLKKAYGAQPLFSDVTFTVNPRERVGLVGRNGHGKSTLFRIIIGQEEQDGGTISTPRGYRIGHLAQHIRFTSPTILEEVCLGLPPEMRDQSYRAEEILMGLGFSKESMMAPPSSFSGGFQLRLNLAKLLLSEPDLLLLDEPTNYLDIVSVRWLTRELQRWRGEIMIISHDRTFMDSITTHTLGIHRQKVRKVEGGTERLYSVLAEEEEVYERTRANEERKREELEKFIRRFRAQASKAALVQSRIKLLEKTEVGEKLSQIEDLDFVFTKEEFPAKTLLTAEDLSFGYAEGDDLFANLSFSVEKGARIGVIGKNGRGKSTLLKVLARELAPRTGEVKTHDRASLGFFAQTNVARLREDNTIEQEISGANGTLSRTRIRGICGAMMFDGNKAEKKISVLSGGERSRVLLGKILATPTNLLLLDEPTSHLDMESIDALVESIQSFEGAVIIVTHSELILRALATKLIVFRNQEVEVFDGDYDDFLRRRGWEDEEDGPSNERAGKAPVQKQKERSGNGTKEREKLIRKLTKQISALEEKFSQLDGEIKRLEEELISKAASATHQELSDLAALRGQKEEEQMHLLEQIESLQKEMEGA